MNLSICISPDCKVTLSHRPVRYNRGDRMVVVMAPFYECASCSDPDTGTSPFRFVDVTQMKEAENLAAEAWQKKYGEPIPPPRRPGRKPEEPKEERVMLLLSKTELARLDTARGELPRNEYIRRAISQTIDSERKAG